MAQVHRLAKEIWLVHCFYPFLTHFSLSRTHWRPGDLFYLNAAGQPMVILNSRKVCVDLLERRAAIYSDRPPNVVLCDLMCNGLLFGLARYDDT
jgi:hypothetical protein